MNPVEVGCRKEEEVGEPEIARSIPQQLRRVDGVNVGLNRAHPSRLPRRPSPPPPLPPSLRTSKNDAQPMSLSNTGEIPSSGGDTEHSLESNTVIVVLGASGDLAKKKVRPAASLP